MQQLLSILVFYRSFVIWSFFINIAIIVVNPNIVPAIVTKLMLTIFVWYFVNETGARRKLVLYKNMGISQTKLFSILFLVDVLFTISFLIIIKEFI